MHVHALCDEDLTSEDELLVQGAGRYGPSRHPQLGKNRLQSPQVELLLYEIVIIKTRDRQLHDLVDFGAVRGGQQWIEGERLIRLRSICAAVYSL